MLGVDRAKLLANFNPPSQLAVKPNPHVDKVRGKSIVNDESPRKFPLEAVKVFGLVISSKGPVSSHQMQQIPIPPARPKLPQYTHAQCSCREWTGEA